jgi:hypothetical protein
MPPRPRDRQPRSNLLATLAELPGPVGVGAIRRGVPAGGSVRWATVVASKPMTMGIVLVASLAVSMALAETPTIVGAAPISLDSVCHGSDPEHRAYFVSTSRSTWTRVARFDSSAVMTAPRALGA